MFPLRDENPTERLPIVTLAIIVVNVAAWLLVEGAGEPAQLAASVCEFGVIPAELTGAPALRVPGDALRCPLGGLRWETVLTSMFMHGSWLHLLGNMWFLWLFGNNVEDSTGRLRFVVFYLLTGALAVAAQALRTPGSTLPMVGASGAISGVMGGYLVLYPRVRVYTAFVLLLFVRVIAVPAWLVLLEWLALQLASGLTSDALGGVAFWAHVGGFASGALAIRLFARGERVRARHGAW